MSFLAAIKGPGITIPWLNDSGGAVNIGSVQKVKRVYGVVVGSPTEDATTTLATSAIGELQVAGLVRLPKKSADTPAQGQDMYWDVGNSRLTTTIANNTRIGPAVLGPGDLVMPGNGDLAMHILLNAAGGDNSGASPQIFSLLAVTATAGTYTVATPTRRMRVIDWFFYSRDTTASNVKLVNNVTDMTTTVAKGTVDAARVQGTNLISAAQVVASGDPIKVVTSGNASIDIFIVAVPEEA